jgi:hypothetical protein
MASRSETIVSRSLRKTLAELAVGTPIEVTDEFRCNVLAGLEFFLPEVLGELYTEWRGDSFDGFYPAILRKAGDCELEFFGLGILINDQTLVPIYLSLQVDPRRDEVSWLMLKIGEKLTGERGETGRRGMKRLDYSSLNSALSRIYRLDGDTYKIDWAYKVTLGERRCGNSN